MLHRVDIFFLFTSFESLRLERREREQIFRVSSGGVGDCEIPKYPQYTYQYTKKINQNSCKIPKSRKPQYALYPKFVLSEVRSTCSATSHVLRFWTINKTHQSLGENLIYPALNYIDISF